MLIPFTVDPDIFIESSDDLSCRKKHNTLLQFWSKFGVLVIPGEKESDSKLLISFRQAPQSIQSIWKSGFRHYRKIRCSSKFADALALDIPIRDENLCAGIRLVSLDRDRGELWGLDGDHYSMVIANNLEICRFGDETETAVVKDVIADSMRPIAAEDLPEKIWRNRFFGLAHNARVITVVDRYALKNFINSPRDGLDGLEFFISKISIMSTANRKIINIFSAYSIEWNLFGKGVSFEKGIQLAIREMNTRFQRLFSHSISEISINIASDSSFGRPVHYRYVLFDQQTLIQLDTGLESLGHIPTNLRRTCPCSLIEWLSEVAEPYRSDYRKLVDVVEHSERLTP